MNMIHQLYDQKFVEGYFKKRILPLYPAFRSIKKIDIHGIKNHIWEKTYHVVVGYDTLFIDHDNQMVRLQIYCSAHSNEQRKNVYDALKFLWSRGFNYNHLTIPRPLFYAKRFKGIFYRGIKGKNLYRYLRVNAINEIEPIIVLTARWFAKLHQLDTAGARNFNKNNSLVETTVPGAKHWLKSIEQKQPKYFGISQDIFQIINKKEKAFLKSTSRRWLIHGDAHPENIIKISDDKVGVIDFTDMCLADFTRDLGSFTQQFEYMSLRHAASQAAITRLKDLFLQEYLKAAELKLTDELQERIQNYYNWTALRTALFFLVKEHPEPDRAETLLNQLKDNLGL